MKRIQESLIRMLVAALLLSCLAVAVDFQDSLRRWNDLYFDLLVTKDRQPAPNDVLLIEIDPRSLDALGRWPWSRQLHAELIEQLTRQRARVVTFDVLFAEPDADDPSGDRRLIDAAAAHGRVVLPVAPESVESNGYLIETMPYPGLSSAAFGLGHVDLALSPDGNVRQVFLRAGLGTPRWPHLALATLDAASGSPPGRFYRRATGDHGPGNRLAWVRDNLVRFANIGPRGHFQRASYVDVLRGLIPDSLIRDRIVFVGAAAPGLSDSVTQTHSAGHAHMAGVEIVANVFEAARQQRFYRPLGTHAQLALTALLVFVGTGIAVLLFDRRRRRVPVLLVFLPLITCTVILLASNQWFDPMPAAVALALGYVALLFSDVQVLDRLLSRERHVANQTLQMLAEAVLTFDRQGRVRYLNPAAERLTGWSADDAIDRPVGEVFRANAEDSGHVLNLPGFPQDDVAFMPYWVLTRHDGSQRVVRISYGFSTDAEDLDGGDVVVTFSDVTTERRLTEKLQHQASHDALTEMPNRTLLNDRLHLAIARAKRHGHSIAVLFSDLDDFKKINDTLGHACGDALLQIIAQRLQVNVRAEDTVARVGGDEFVILIEQLSDTGTALTTARKLVEAVRQPLEINGHQLRVSTSIGLSCYPHDGAYLEDLLRNADLAMYSAKAQGGNTVALFKPEMKDNALERFTLDNDLQNALEKQEFRIYYQPLFDMNTRRIVGAEALLRWQHPQRGLLTPDVMISAAERSRQIVQIGEWVLRTACMQLRAWQMTYGVSLRMAVNLSPRQLENRDFPATVAQIIALSGIQPECLELEITEDVLMSDAQGERETLRELSALGVGLTIDDFGTGYSWFSYLKHLPVTRLKIDRSFIYELTSQKDDAAIVRAIIAMAKSLRLSITAEGVETRAQANLLQKIGCEICQGFFFAGPLDAESFAELLSGTPTGDVDALRSNMSDSAESRANDVRNNAPIPFRRNHPD